MRTLSNQVFVIGSRLSEGRISELENEYPDYDYAVITYRKYVGLVVLMTREEVVKYAKEWANENCQNNLEEISLKVNYDEEGNVLNHIPDGEKCFEKFRMSPSHVVQNLR